jgi:hypothetical protein
VELAVAHADALELGCDRCGKALGRLGAGRRQLACEPAAALLRLLERRGRSCDGIEACRKPIQLCARDRGPLQQLVRRRAAVAAAQIGEAIQLAFDDVEAFGL